MAFDFPSPAAEGSLFSPPGGPQYVMKGGAWCMQGLVPIPLLPAFIQRRLFTASQTISLHADTTWYMVQVQGGGGGGQNTGTGSTAGNAASGVGGGAGSYGEKFCLRDASTGQGTITIGAGGTSTVNGGASSWVDGNNNISAPGGIGGGANATNHSHIWLAPGAAAAAATGGDFNQPGRQGEWSLTLINNAGNAVLAKAGRGGDSVLGPGSSPGGATSGTAGGAVGNSASAAGYGGGGGGSYSMNAGGSFGGGTGSSGCVIVTEFR